MISSTKLADDLESVQVGALSALEFVTKYSEYANDLLVQNVLAGFNHFSDDEDIRKRDTAYAEMQEKELRKMISLLRAGAQPLEIGRIHFLGYSVP
jgi:hypothetical protein